MVGFYLELVRCLVYLKNKEVAIFFISTHGAQVPWDVGTSIVLRARKQQIQIYFWLKNYLTLKVQFQNIISS